MKDLVCNQTDDSDVTVPPRPRRALYNPAAAARIGRVLQERYWLDSLLGLGAMGEVYRATDLQRQQPCAVKLVFAGASRSLQADRRFSNEARLIGRLSHPNIVQVRDFNEDQDGTKFLVMELLEGQDLHELLSQQVSLPLPQVLRIVRSVGTALQYAHDLGIVHRDIKPNNVFVTQGREEGACIKVLDFGLAKLLSGNDVNALERLTQGIIVGTPAYLSPEATELAGGPVDVHTDQWSLAVLTYQMLSGRLPFSHPNPFLLCQKICSEEPVPLSTLIPGLPAHIYQTIATAMAKRPDQRFPKVSDFVRGLESVTSLSEPVPLVNRGVPRRSTQPNVLLPDRLPAASERAEPPPPGVTRRIPLLASMTASEPLARIAPTTDGLPRTVRYSEEDLKHLCRLASAADEAPAAQSASAERQRPAPLHEGPTSPYRTLPVELLSRAAPPAPISTLAVPAAVLTQPAASPKSALAAQLAARERGWQVVGAGSLLLGLLLLALLLVLHRAYGQATPLIDQELSWHEAACLRACLVPASPC